MSIIDWLQDWNKDKKLERFSKRYFLKKDASLLSAVQPKKYCPRFFTFMMKEVFINQQQSDNRVDSIAFDDDRMFREWRDSIGKADLNRKPNK